MRMGRHVCKIFLEIVEKINAEKRRDGFHPGQKLTFRVDSYCFGCTSPFADYFTAVKSFC